MKITYEEYNKYIQEIENSQMKMVFCKKFDEKSNIWNLEKHKHSFIELIYFLNGNAHIEILSENISISLYDMIIYPKDAYHKETLDMSKHQEIFCLGFEASGFELNHIIHLPDNHSNLRWLFESIYNEGTRPDCRSELISHYIKSIFILTLRNYYKKELETKDGIDLVVEYLHDHFVEPISIQELAELIHVSESYLIRSFKKKTNTTPLKYINMLRIEAAKHILCTSNQSVEEVSYMTGFNSPKYFSRIFKALTGETASSFKS